MRETPSEISADLAIPLTTVRRYEKYIGQLGLADLTREEIAEKRQEIYIEVLEASERAKQLFDTYRELKKNKVAKMWFTSWLDSLKIRMQLYGLDSMKSGSFTQINQQINTYESEKVDTEAGRKIADIIKKTHEDKIKKV